VTAAASGAPQPAGLDIAVLNAAPADEFRRAVAALFEGAPGLLGRLAAARPFDSRDDLFGRAREIAHALPEPLQVELLDAHPRLGAPPASVSALSYREQGYGRARAAVAAGTDRSSADAALVEAAIEPERARTAVTLEDLNDAYERRFGFRYCVFVAGRSHAELIPEMAAALGADRAAELERALDAVIDIARDRWRALEGGDVPGGSR
jgi:2-oxo-4-hydroxy-4-carboxy-5-ureidoimidazoline decarboxylase